MEKTYLEQELEKLNRTDLEHIIKYLFFAYVNSIPEDLKPIQALLRVCKNDNTPALSLLEKISKEHSLKYIAPTYPMAE